MDVDKTSLKEIPKVRFNDVYFSWPGKNNNVINKCSFSITKTGLWMIVGKNGSGKSTLLKLINGILQPTNGVVERLANIGMVFQNPDQQILMPNCRSEMLININENLSRNDINFMIDNALNKVGLNGFEKRPIYTLSGGQKQRLTIASALSAGKNFLLMDEPTSLLDTASQLKVLKIIKNLTKNTENPLTALWITHRLEELDYADGVAEMRNGSLSAWQEPSNFQYN